MNEFDHRWQACAAQARRAAGDDAPAPAGFATRVWARWQAGQAAASAALWAPLSLRAAVVAAIALALCVAVDYCTAPSGSALAPHLEDLVTSVWGAS